MYIYTVLAQLLAWPDNAPRFHHRLQFGSPYGQTSPELCEIQIIGHIHSEILIYTLFPLHRWHRLAMDPDFTNNIWNWVPTSLTTVSLKPPKRG